MSKPIELITLCTYTVPAVVKYPLLWLCLPLARSTDQLLGSSSENSSVASPTAKVARVVDLQHGHLLRRVGCQIEEQLEPGTGGGPLEPGSVLLPPHQCGVA
jgi:hypothetical protein